MLSRRVGVAGVGFGAAGRVIIGTPPRDPFAEGEVPAVRRSEVARRRSDGSVHVSVGKASAGLVCRFDNHVGVASDKERAIVGGGRHFKFGPAKLLHLELVVEVVTLKGGCRLGG